MENKTDNYCKWCRDNSHEAFSMQCLVQTSKVTHARDHCDYSSSSNTWYSTQLWGVRELEAAHSLRRGKYWCRGFDGGNGVAIRIVGRDPKERDDDIAIRMVTAEMGPGTEVKRKHWNTILSTELLLLSLHAVTHLAAFWVLDLSPNPWPHPKDLPFDKEVGVGVRCLSTERQTCTGINVQRKLETKGKWFPKAYNYLFLNISSFIPSPFKNLLF